MLQNKLLFNQSSVSLEIIGLPDYSNNENKDQISIITSWKLMITDKPDIEGNIDHLRKIMGAFYSYSSFLINNEIPFFESKLIDIKADNINTHNITLKSSKSDVKPLNIKIGNSVLSDIIFCFDQFKSSKKVKKLNLDILRNNYKKGFLNSIKKDKFTQILLPPLLSLCSMFLVSSAFIYFQNNNEEDKNVFINLKKVSRSIKTAKTIL